MASLPVCFVLGGCGAESTSITSSEILPPTANISVFSTLRPSSLGTSHSLPSSVSLVTLLLSPTSTPTPSLSDSSIPLQTSSVEPFPRAPAAFEANPISRSCDCTSTGTIVGIALAAASAASVLTMLFLLCILRRHNRFVSTKSTRRMTDPFLESKTPKPSPSSIRDTVILISPDRETHPVSGGAEMRRSSESVYSQDSRHTRDLKTRPDPRSSVPQLPALSLSPPLLLLPGPSSPNLEPRTRLSVPASTASPPAQAQTHHPYAAHAGNGDARRGLSIRSSQIRIPSVIGSFDGSHRGPRLPRLVEVGRRRERRHGRAAEDESVSPRTRTVMPGDVALSRDGRAVPAPRRL